MTFQVHGSTKRIIPHGYTMGFDNDVSIAEGGAEALSARPDNSAELAGNAEIALGFRYGVSTEGSSLDLEPGFTASWDQADRKFFQIIAAVNASIPEFNGPEEGAEDAIDIQIWDLEGEVLAKSEEAEAASGGVDVHVSFPVAVVPTGQIFTLKTPVMSARGGDGFRVVLVNRPTGDEAADGEAVTYSVQDGTIVIIPGN